MCYSHCVICFPHPGCGGLRVAVSIFLHIGRRTGLKILRPLRGDRRILDGENRWHNESNTLRVELWIQTWKPGFDTKENKTWKTFFVDNFYPIGRSKSSKNQSKIDFWEQNGSPRRPSCTQGPQVEGKRCPKSPKGSPETPQDSKRAAKRPQNVTKSAPKM